MATTQTFSAAQVAQAVTRVTGVYMSPKRIRGWSRGDSGKPVVARYGHDVKAPRMSHAYGLAEANALGARAVAAHNASTGQTRKWNGMLSRASSKPATGSKPASKGQTRKPASKPATATQTAPQTDASNV